MGKEKLATEADYSQYLLHLFPFSGVLFSLLFFLFIAFCFLHKMVASCFRFKLKWRPRLLAAAIRELCGSQLTQSHPPLPLFLTISPGLPVILTCATFYYNQRKLIFPFFYATFREKSVESSASSSFSGFMRCDFFPQLLKPSNSLFSANAIRDFNACPLVSPPTLQQQRFYCVHLLSHFLFHFID